MKIYRPKNITKVRIAKRAMEIVMKENTSVTYSKLRNLFLSSNTCEKLFDDNSTLGEEGPGCVATLFKQEIKL